MYLTCLIIYFCDHSWWIKSILSSGCNLEQFKELHFVPWLVSPAVAVRNEGPNSDHLLAELLPTTRLNGSVIVNGAFLPWSSLTWLLSQPRRQRQRPLLLIAPARHALRKWKLAQWALILSSLEIPYLYLMEHLVEGNSTLRLTKSYLRNSKYNGNFN